MASTDDDGLDATLDVAALAQTLSLDATTVREAARTLGGDGEPDTDELLARLNAEGYIDARTYRDVVLAGPLQPDALAGVGGAESSAYDVFGRIAEGGMGEIRVARDRGLRRQVAMKRLKALEGVGDGGLTRRFVTEAQVTAQLDHPGVVPVYALRIDEDGDPSFYMKLVDGHTLGDVIEEAAECHERGVPVPDELSSNRRLEHFLKVCDAVRYAHSKGVIHRDLKPANVMVGRFSEVYLMDWGIAKVTGVSSDPDATVEDVGALTGVDASAGAGMTAVGSVLGTPGYMAPEQIHGATEELDGRADLYSLGMVLWELVTLQHPLDGLGLTDLLAAALKGDLPRPTHVASPSVQVPPDLVAIVRKATARERDERYPSVEDLAVDVRRFLAGEEVVARPDNIWRRIVRWTGRHRQGTLIALLAALLVAAAALSWSLWSEMATAERARAREAALTGFQTWTATRAHRINSHFVRFEGMLVHLAEKAGYLLEHGEPQQARLFSNHDFDAAAPSQEAAGSVAPDPARGPADLARSPLYGKAVSLDSPVYKLAPGLELATVEDRIRRLLPLGDHARWMLAMSDPDYRANAPASPIEARRRLLVEGVPLRWIYVGLEEGVMFSFPGKGGYPPEYDPRRRPWYGLGQGRPLPSWGNAYLDLQGQGYVLPGVVGAFDDDGGFLGVAGVELTFDYIIGTYMDTADRPEVEEVFVLDGEGHTVVRSSQPLGAARRHGELHEAKKLPLFHLPEVRAAVVAGRSGQLEVSRPSGAAGGPRARGPIVASFYRIPALSWTYVATATISDLLAVHEPAASGLSGSAPR